MENQKIHRARTWELVAFGTGALAINLYGYFMGFISYYINGYLGVAVVFATSFATVMRIWDAVTDPVAGNILDRITLKFGKYRTFMFIGNVGMMITTFIMLHFPHTLSDGLRLPVFVVIYLVYVLFMTMENLIGRAGLSILTNDAGQRATSGVFSGIATRLVYSFAPAVFYGTLSTKYGGFNLEFFDAAWKIIAPLSFIFTIIAMAGIASSDRPEFMIKNTGSVNKLSFKNYWDVLKNNRAMQMLVVAASTDKLASQVQSNATTSVLLYGIVCGNLAISGAISAYTGIPNMIFIVFGCGLIGAKLGQIGAMKLASWGGLIVCVLLMLISMFGDMTTLALPGNATFNGWNLLSISFLVLYILMKGFSSVGTSVISPMIADVTDYETCRTGNFVPGMIGMIFSFVDKFISSFGATIVGLLCALIGFTETLPTKDTPYSTSIHMMAVFCMFGLVAIGLICNLIAMKFYPLTREKMKEVQLEIAGIKARKGVKA